MESTNELHKSPASMFQTSKRCLDDNNVSYTLPRGDEGNNRLFKQHNLLRHFFNGPIKENLEIGSDVLDSGCGSGVWTVDIAREYPNSSFYGIDISDVVPNEWKLQNTEYTTRDITKTLPYNNNFFDYIHQRLLVLGLTRDK